jgi:myosin-crossreactive antigen
MRNKTRSTRDWQVNSIGWTITRRFNYAFSTNSQLLQVIAGHVQSIGCVLDAYRSRLAVKSGKLIADTAFRTRNSFLCFVASPAATATITSPGSAFATISTATNRQSVEGKTVGTLTITGSGNARNLTIPRTATSYQVSARRFAFVYRQFSSTSGDYIESSVSETTDMLVVRA